MAHRVVGQFAAVTVDKEGGNGDVRILERGAIVPEGVSDGVLDHLVSVGQIEFTPDSDDDSGEDLSGLSVGELKARAADLGIELDAGAKKADIIAALNR